MNEIGEKYLPIGSVVILKNATKRIMITGFASMSPETGNTVYDYSGCMYPEGFFDYNQVCVFNHEDIAQLFSKGYVDDEQVAFEKKLVEEMNKVSNKNNE